MLLGWLADALERALGIVAAEGERCGLSVRAMERVLAQLVLSEQFGHLIPRRAVACSHKQHGEA